MVSFKQQLSILEKIRLVYDWDSTLKQKFI